MSLFCGYHSITILLRIVFVMRSPHKRWEREISFVLYSAALESIINSPKQLHDLLERVFNTKWKSFIATNNFRTIWTNDRTSTRYTYFSCRELCLAIDFLIDNIYVRFIRFGSSVFRQVIGIPMGTNSAPLLADLFLHTFEHDFMVKTLKQDITKAIQFSNTFRYINDLFSVNNMWTLEITSAQFNRRNWNLRTLPHHLLKYVISTLISRLATTHLSVSASTIRERTLHFGLSTFLIWIATFPPIQLTVFIYPNWWNMPEFARPSWLHK